MSWTDPYIDKTSGCLVNKLKITDQKTLDLFESTLSSIRLVELAYQPLPRRVDFDHLKATHLHIFQDIYPWAGDVRSVHLQKGSTHFMPPSRLDQGGHYLFDQLAKEKQLQGLSENDFSDRAGYYLGEINHLHPFREGNGRTQRAFINQLAAQNNYHICWDDISREQMIKASIEADLGEPQKMSQLIRENLIDREDQLVFERDSQQDHLTLHRAKPNQTYYGRIVSLTDRYVVQERRDKPCQLILHSRQTLTPPIERADNTILRISYPHGAIGLVQQEKKLRQDLALNCEKESKSLDDYERSF